MKNLKLFVWTDWAPDIQGGLAFAIAENENEARQMIIKRNGEISPIDWGKLHVHSMKKKIIYSNWGGG